MTDTKTAQANQPYRLAALNAATWCREQASDLHGYVPIATEVDHDLAHAFEQIADAIEAGTVGRASSTADIERRLKELDYERTELLLELRDRRSVATTGSDAR